MKYTVTIEKPGSVAPSRTFPFNTIRQACAFANGAFCALSDDLDQSAFNDPEQEQSMRTNPGMQWTWRVRYKGAVTITHVPEDQL